MRGTPISSLTARSVTRGFYVTKSDVETTITSNTTPDYVVPTTDFSLENETTIIPLDASDATEMINPAEVSAKSKTTILEDTNEPYSENASLLIEPPRTTPVVNEITTDGNALSTNDVSSAKPTRKIRGRVRYTDGTTPLYGHRTRNRFRSTAAPNYSNIDVSSNLENNVTSTIKYEELEFSRNLTAGTTVSGSENLERETTPLDDTLKTELSDTMTPATSTPMTTIFEIETIQPESSTFRSNIQTTLAQKVENEIDTDNIIFDKSDGYGSTVMFDYATKHDITTAGEGSTTSNLETTSEITTLIKETESRDTVNVETTTTSYPTTENEDISSDITTITSEPINVIVSKSSLRIEETTTSSETTEFPSTGSSNLSSSENPVTIEEIREENIPRQRQILNDNQFGRRTRKNGYRRIVQRKEIEDRTSTQKLDNSNPNRRHRVRIHRTRQRRPVLASSGISTGNNIVSIDDARPYIAEEETKKLKLGDQNEYIEETIPRNTLQDATPPTPVTEEYTERPVDEDTLLNGSGSSSGRTKSGTRILVNRLRNTNGSSQSSSSVTRPSTVLGDNRKNRPNETNTVSPTATIVDAFEDATVSSPEQSIKDEDNKAEISDQNGRAQELAVTLADPPSTSRSSSNTGRLPLRDTLRRRISTTVAPRTDSSRTSSSRFSTVSKNRQRPTSTTRKEGTTQSSTTRRRRPTITDYDYYEDEEIPIIEKSMYNGKLLLTSKGTIKCLDQGNFPHPYSCKKFITCARIVNGLVIGAEYTCPDKLSFDPVGGICNWSAGLGCKE